MHTTQYQPMVGLFAQREQLAQEVYRTHRDELWKGSDAWRAHKEAWEKLTKFDLEHPEIRECIEERFEEYLQVQVQEVEV